MKIAILALAGFGAACCQSLPSPGPGMPVVGGVSDGGGTCTPAGGYAHCRVLTINHTLVGGAALSSFPVLVSAVLGISRLQNANCYDVAFTSDSGGTTLIPWEQETCAQSTGTIVTWVLASGISSTVDTRLYVSYGNAAISTAQNIGALASANVWDSSFRGVWHLSGSLTADSTHNGFNGVVTGVTPDAGQIGGSGHWNSGTDAITVSNFTAFARPMTIDLWTNSNSWQEYLQGSPYSGNFLFYSNGSRPSFYVSGAQELTGPTIGQIDGAWHHIAATIDGAGNGRLYFDGAPIASAAGMAPNTSATLVFGSNYSSLQLKNLDEVKISNTVRSAGWIAAEYNNQKTNSLFVTIGSEI